MFRRVLAVFLIVCLQSISFGGLLAAAGFKMNREYIVAKLCVNRAKPKLNCKGKCYLNKIQKEAEKQKEANNTTLKEVFYLMPLRKSVLQVCLTVIGTCHTLHNNNSRQKGWIKTPFHPPGILS